ncbi:alpha/beta hydrolase-fold protein [Thalassomonas actiniarum]|uniref:Alpha/beta hydrolase n=1 Tax=Thalassomonas actiniarum TaxID=485447 RepID=A0AAE9YS23_9GAMM|nr:alpha/beta hydrolase-fold protein [Thalassomonas actiniarum]WDD99403.1 alpha/beta hydrolase [Thalassomonas actiniarum]
MKKLSLHAVFIRGCLTLFSLLSLAVFAGEPVVFGHSEKFFSKVLNEERSLLIKLPQGYRQSGNKTYPVLYTLDGQSHYRRVAGTLEWLSDTAEMIPQHIVVGLVADNGRQRLRDASPFKRASYKNGSEASGDTFIRFLKTELIPYIDKKYRTRAFRTLAGHSAMARGVLHIMSSTDNLFQAYIAMSPALSDRERNKAFVENIGNKISDQDRSATFYYQTLGNEAVYRGNFERLSKVFASRAPENFTWFSEYYPLETHMSVPSKTLHNAMLALAHYRGWTAAPSVVNQGLAAVTKHYQALAKQQNRAVSPPEALLINMSYDAYFAKKYQQAVAGFELAVKLYPGSVNARDSLADGYEAAGQLARALNQQKVAVKLAKEQNADNLQQVREHLQSLAEKIQAKPLS